MSLKDFFSTSIGCLIPLIGTALYIMGGIHSEKKHNEGSLAWWIPPFGIYRGFEEFWHTDKTVKEKIAEDKSIDWDKRVVDDISTASTLILLSDDAKDMDEERMEIEKLSKKILQYPDDKKKKISDGVLCFLKYNLNAGEDVNAYIKDLIIDTSATLRFKSITTLEYDSLANYYKMPEAVQLKGAMDSIYKKSPFAELTKKQLRDVYDKSQSGLSSHLSIYKTYFKKIFDEDYNTN